VETFDLGLSDFQLLTTVMKIQRFEDIIAWQKAQDLGVLVYRHFDESKDRSFRSQITRASVSVSNNIAEGFNRNSDKEFSRFLNIARASCDEVKSMTYLASRLGFIDDPTKIELIQTCEEVSRVIFGLLKALK
jgi:four helix bundle protein